MKRHWKEDVEDIKLEITSQTQITQCLCCRQQQSLESGRIFSSSSCSFRSLTSSSERGSENCKLFMRKIQKVGSEDFEKAAHDVCGEKRQHTTSGTGFSVCVSVCVREEMSVLWPTRGRLFPFSARLSDHKFFPPAVGVDGACVGECTRRLSPTVSLCCRAFRQWASRGVSRRVLFFFCFTPIEWVDFLGKRKN